MAYKSVNRSVPRIEGADKVSGNMRYAADLNFPAALAAKILRTSLPHARIVSIDTRKAAKLRGVPWHHHRRRCQRRHGRAAHERHAAARP